MYQGQAFKTKNNYPNYSKSPERKKEGFFTSKANKTSNDIYCGKHINVFDTY